MIDATPPPPSRRPLGNVDTNRLNSRQSCILHKHMLCIHCHEACKSCEPTTGCIGCEASRSVSPNKGQADDQKRREDDTLDPYKEIYHHSPPLKPQMQQWILNLK